MAANFNNDIPTNSIVIVINRNDKVTYVASELKEMDKVKLDKQIVNFLIGVMK